MMAFHSWVNVPDSMRQKSAGASEATLSATPYRWREPGTIPPRDWLYGRHLLRGVMSLTVAPGGVGKSSLMIVQAIELASGKSLLGHALSSPKNVWLFNLEDDRTELERRVCAAMAHHGIAPDAIADRLYLDTGLDQSLVLAHDGREELFLNEGVFQCLEQVILQSRIDVLIIDPFVSAHQVNEADNGRIDRIAKRIGRLAADCDCAIELVHHTRKLNGVDVTSEASRGASSLLAAARSARTIQLAGDRCRREWGVSEDRGTYFFVQRDKANLAFAGGKESYRTVSTDLGQGDQVGVVERFAPPDLFDGVSRDDLLKVQRAIDGKEGRFSCQSPEWVGFIVADALGLEPRKNRPRIKKMIDVWIKNGALEIRTYKKNSRPTPVVVVGAWANE